MAKDADGYHRALPLTTEQLQRMCSERVYQMAWRYAKSCHVSDRMRVESSLTAKFHGTRGIYTTAVKVGDGETEFRCNCPLGGGREPCKHVIALGLIWLHEPASFHDLDLTLARLGKLTKAELLTLLREVANRIPEVVPLLDRETP